MGPNAPSPAAGPRPAGKHSRGAGDRALRQEPGTIAGRGALGSQPLPAHLRLSRGAVAGRRCTAGLRAVPIPADGVVVRVGELLGAQRLGRGGGQCAPPPGSSASESTPRALTRWVPTKAVEVLLKGGEGRQIWHLHKTQQNVAMVTCNPAEFL